MSKTTQGNKREFFRSRTTLLQEQAAQTRRHCELSDPNSFPLHSRIRPKGGAFFSNNNKEALAHANVQHSVNNLSKATSSRSFIAASKKRAVQPQTNLYGQTPRRKPSGQRLSAIPHDEADIICHASPR